MEKQIQANFTITQAQIGERLDRFLTNQFSQFPRAYIQTQIENQNVSLNNKPAKSSYRLRLNDVIYIGMDHPKDYLQPEPIEKQSFQVIFEHPDFVIINKPAGLTVHPSEYDKFDTLVNELLFRYEQIKQVGEDPTRPGIVHRLDKDTSGLMIIPLNQASFQYFKKLFQDRKIEKKYLAWVWGTFGQPEGSIGTFIGRSLANPTKQSTNTDPDNLSNPKEALTFYTVLKEKNNTTLLELKPKTGRKHQVRIHLHSIGHPLLGDKKYELRPYKNANKKYPHYFLHAQTLSFYYKDKKEYLFEAPLPEYFQNVDKS